MFSVLIVLAAGTAALGDQTTWSTKGQQILVNDGKTEKSFFGKGVSYAPCPIGGSADFAPFQDFFNKKWESIYNRDIPLLQKMGANLIKVYGWWGFLPTKGNEWNGAPNNLQKNMDKELVWSIEDKGDGLTGTFDHTEFLDKLWENGIYILIGIGIDVGETFDNADTDKRKMYYEFYKQTAVWTAQKYRNHPAVMGFCLGNELNNPSRLQRDDFWQKLNDMADAVKKAAPGKLVTSAWQNDPNIFKGTYPKLDENTHFDFWGMNVYNGKTFGEFWDRLQGLIDRGHGKPVLFTEWGAPTGKHSPENEKGPPQGTATVSESNSANRAVGDYLTSLWQDMSSDAHKLMCSGGTVFEWSDEWWKIQNTGTNGAAPQVWLHDASYAPATGYPGNWWEEEWWGLNSIETAPGRDPKSPTDNNGNPLDPDKLTQREGYNRLKCLWTTGMDCIPPKPDVVISSLAGGPDGESANSQQLSISLDMGSHGGTNAAWFLAYGYMAPYYQAGQFEIYQYDLNMGWVLVKDQIVPVMSMPLFSFESVIIGKANLPSGTHAFLFGVDPYNFGQLDSDLCYFDFEIITVP